MELLVPIKDKASAILAINLKAKALYCSGPHYSARQAANISYEDLQAIIEYAHLYQCRVYLALNILIFNDTFDDVKKEIDILVKMGIDALIMQDLGLLYYVKQVYPQLEIHSSTQMSIHNEYGLLFAQNNNIKRVVLPRELSFKTIKRYHHLFSNIELETFIHGALCTSYSGQCYYSAFNKRGSGNLGTCEQNCRRHHYFNDDSKNY
ncbi:MAG: U32 family peptidase, partial [Bacilli bacterium]|nr:U32 family peptidase [Bacilli bacterium]